jgi:hypothetical protein
MAEIIRLKPFEPVGILPLQSRAAGVYDQRLWAEGAGLLSTLFVQSIDAGASISAAYYDVSLGDDLGEQMLLGRHDTITSNLQSHKILMTRFYSKPYVRVTLTGGSAIFGVFVAITNPTSDNDYGFGETRTFVGSVDSITAIDLPATPGRVIQGFSVKASSDQGGSHRLAFSMDGGLTYLPLSPGQAFSLAPRGDLRQIRLIAGSNHTVQYEVVMNLGQY